MPTVEQNTKRSQNFQNYYNKIGQFDFPFLKFWSSHWNIMVGIVFVTNGGSGE